jgi:choline dehydrogenase-like flavoprotein
MVDAFQQAETFHNKDWFHPETKAHGNTGPLHTTPHDLAPISKLVLESYQEAGLPLHEDMFTTGETPTGSCHAPRTVHDGIRSTGADFVSDRARWPNLDIRFNATVDKVTLSKNLGGDLQATGVDVVFKDGSKNSFKARKEVVISGGAYCSPAILLRSGIGPKEDLEELKIPVMSNVPGVGKNLQDHLVRF